MIHDIKLTTWLPNISGTAKLDSLYSTTLFVAEDNGGAQLSVHV